MPLYFAFGSNMHPAQMQQRCPGARAVGVAQLADFAFSLTPRGGANIVSHRGQTVWGVLWRCTPAHLATLDAYEGVRIRNYRRAHVCVTDPAGAKRHAVTYRSDRRWPGRARVDYMLTAVIPGAIAHALPASYVAALQAFLPRVAIGEKRRRYRGRRV
ncbi:MAG: gamma-glutamylcyclotransferase family protein [Pseudomonadota bacterium]